MNKKHITLILIGVMLLVLQFYVKIGGVSVDVCSDILAFVLIVIGICPLSERNILYKKARNVSFIGLVAAIVCQVLFCMNWGDSTQTVITIVSAITTVFTIYFSYYFTEALILEAKFQDKAAVTRTLRVTWVLFGALKFVHYIAFMSNVSIAGIGMQILTAVSAIYYCMQVLTAGEQLYMEGLPTAHMDMSANNRRK